MRAVKNSLHSGIGKRTQYSAGRNCSHPATFNNKRNVISVIPAMPRCFRPQTLGDKLYCARHTKVVPLCAPAQSQPRLTSLVIEITRHEFLAIQDSHRFG